MEKTGPSLTPASKGKVESFHHAVANNLSPIHHHGGVTVGQVWSSDFHPRNTWYPCPLHPWWYKRKSSGVPELPPPHSSNEKPLNTGVSVVAQWGTLT